MYRLETARIRINTIKSQINKIKKIFEAIIEKSEKIESDIKNSH